MAHWKLPLAATAGLALLLVAYLVIALRVQPAQIAGTDEPGYLAFAENLLHGFYSPFDHVNLWWGPGYPLLLAAILGLHLPLVLARALNACFMVGAVVLTFLTLRRYVPRPAAYLAAAYIAVSLPLLQDMRFLITECLTAFLLSAWLYCCCRLFASTTPLRWVVACSLILAYLALTKVIFGYVIIGFAIISLAGAIVRQTSLWYFVAICVIALLICSPYLLYTYSITGRLFYWSNAGGASLYWMAVPYAGEMGDWRGLNLQQVQAGTGAPTHVSFFAYLSTLPSIAQDDALREQALRWIREYPFKFALNCLANLGRMVMNYPYTSTPFKPSTSLSLLLLNVPAIVATVVGLSSLVTGRLARPELVGAGVFLAMALLDSLVLSAFPRQFSVLTPLMLFVAADAMARAWTFTGAGRWPVRRLGLGGRASSASGRP